MFSKDLKSCIVHLNYFQKNYTHKVWIDIFLTNINFSHALAPASFIYLHALKYNQLRYVEKM